VVVAGYGLRFGIPRITANVNFVSARRAEKRSAFRRFKGLILADHNCCRRKPIVATNQPEKNRCARREHTAKGATLFRPTVLAAVYLLLPHRIAAIFPERLMDIGSWHDRKFRLQSLPHGRYPERCVYNFVMNELVSALPTNAEPFAKVLGEPVTEMPRDLYIPPEALQIFLETFEGPLDLLLYLIRKHSLDILDIPMAKLTRQYMDYVEAMRQSQFELAAEYLVMAAVLIEIKSRMLLPAPIEMKADEIDPRAELVRRLIEYEQMKKAAEQINVMPQAGRDFALVEVWIEHSLVKRLPEVNVDDLRNAWLALLTRAKLQRHHKIRRDELSVREHMTRILRRLATGVYVEFSDLFNPLDGVPELVVSFLAILELAKESLVQITQNEFYAPIYVKRAGVN
jgi:segregation and condensation protein A